jgi:hypothetical protein
MKPPNIVIKQETEKSKPISSSLSPSGIYLTQSCFQMSNSVNIEVNIDQMIYDTVANEPKVRPQLKRAGEGTLAEFWRYFCYKRGSKGGSTSSKANKLTFPHLFSLQAGDYWNYYTISIPFVWFYITAQNTKKTIRADFLQQLNLSAETTAATNLFDTA